jgi:hypothetical protein
MVMPTGPAAHFEGLMPFKNEFRTKLREHFGKDPSNLTIVSESFAKYNHANVFLAIEDYSKAAGRSATIVGVQNGFMGFKSTTLSELVAPGTAASMVGIGGPKEGPVLYTNIELADGRKLACIQMGLYLIRNQNERLAILLRPDEFMSGMGGGKCIVEVMAQEKQDAERFLVDVQAALSRRSIYRGKVISLGTSTEGMSHGQLEIAFHKLPDITREKIILPEGLLKRIERQSLDATKYKDALLAANRRLKRGLLLHGAPGTGKTLTAMYLASQLKERTVIILTGRGMALIANCCAMARGLQPAMIIIEDVDLIAEERTSPGNCNTSILFELLNQMDGLADDADILFLLTTNRPDILEPALAARPGRIDQAFEVPLPDAECRRRLFDLYSTGMAVKIDDMQPFIKRTEGASAAFINELMRKAALFAAPDGVPIVVEARHLDEALHELVVEGGTLTRSLLGFQKIGFKSERSESI